MASNSHDHDHGQEEAGTDRMHDTSWSVNLEKPQHASDQELIVDEALEAIRHTATGNHVNLVTHGSHGHPSDYLYPVLERVALEPTIDWEYIEQCGCGGHVTRVYVD